MKVVDYVHKDTLTATDYVELNKNNELLMSYNQALLKENRELKETIDKISKIVHEIKELTETINGYPSDYIDNLLEILKEVE